MARLVHIRGHRELHLESDNVVGRSLQSSLRLTASYVSNQHAALTWSAEGWRVRDLGSRNGTWLDQRRLAAGQTEPLRQGASLAFGHPGELWTLTDEAPPEVMLIDTETGEQTVVMEPVLGLPSDAEPWCTLYEGAVGDWYFEAEDGASTRLVSGATFSVNQRVFRFSCPDTVKETATSQTAAEEEAAQLEFLVSSDEEYVEIYLKCKKQSINLGARNHNHLLLTLARARIRDTARGVPTASCGWIYKEDLVSGLQSPERVDNEVFRIRKHLGRYERLLAAQIVERRSRTRQLRIGIGSLKIING